MGAGNTTEEFFDGLVGWVGEDGGRREKMVGVHHKLEIDSASDVPESEMHHREEENRFSKSY